MRLPLLLASSLALLPAVTFGRGPMSMPVSRIVPAPELVLASTFAPDPRPGPSLPAEPRPLPAPVQDQRDGARATPLGLVVELRSDFGLERVTEIEFATGRKVGMHLNDGISGALGLSFLPLADGRLGTRVTAGYKVQYQRAANGSALFTAIPVELVEQLYAGPLRLGVGGSVLLDPRLEGSGFLEDQTRTYSPVPGAVAEIEWLVSARSRTGIGVRGTWSRFTAAGDTRSGPAVGLVVRSDFALVR